MTDVQFVTENAFGELGLTVTSTFSLLSQFITSLDARSIKAPERPKDPPNTFNLIGDSAKLLKAQVTKLSLLVLNRPFTPTAITRILRDISTGCLPALMGATDLVRQKEDGHILFYIIRAPIRRLFRQMINVMGEVPLHETQVAAVKKTDRGTLVSTGIVWETCDLLIEMGKTGLVGIVVQQAQEYRDLLQDAIAELKEWTESAKRPELNLSDDFKEVSEMREYSISSWAEGLEGNQFGYPSVIPENDPKLQAHVEEVVKKLQRVDLIYPPIIKRRLRRFPANLASSDHCQSHTQLELLEFAMETLKLIPEEVDELAAACYQRDHEEIKSQLANVCDRAVKTMEGLSLNWQAEPDEFTEWSKKWLRIMKET